MRLWNCQKQKSNSWPNFKKLEEENGIIFTNRKIRDNVSLFCIFIFPFNF